MLFLRREASYEVVLWLFFDIGCGHTGDLTLVKGFNRGKKDVKKTLL